jgi:hypothetical protein
VISGDGLDLARVEIQEGKRIVGLHLQRIDDVLQKNGRGHGSETLF